MLPRRALLASFLALTASRSAAPAVAHVGGTPLFAAIDAARAADARHTECCHALHDDDSEAADEACNAAADAMTRAVAALARVRPTTHAGLVALVQFYADDADGTDIGAVHLASLLAVLKPPLPS